MVAFVLRGPQLGQPQRLHRMAYTPQRLPSTPMSEYLPHFIDPSSESEAWRRVPSF